MRISDRLFDLFELIVVVPIVLCFLAFSLVVEELL